MALEIEAKIKIDRLESVAQRLKESGARFLAEQSQRDTYFFDTAGQLAKKGCGLRLRTQTAAGQTVSILTFKGPRQNGLYKIRPEHETPVADADVMVKILEGLGYQSRLAVSKTRQLWKLDGCDVCLDDVPPLGFFVEVEGPNEATIKAVLTRLNLADHPTITEGYAAMLARLGKKT